MSESDSKTTDVMTKITEHKLTSTNYLDWRQIIDLYLLSVSMDTHMTDDPPTDDSKLSWRRMDAKLFLQIRNSISSEVVGMVTHCRTVKSLLSYLEFLYSGNISRMYDVCQAFYKPEKADKSLTDYFMGFKKTYEELNVLFPFSADIKVQHAQREKMAVMSFLAGLPPEFENAKLQILSDTQISSLDEAFSRLLRTERATHSAAPQPNSTLVSHAPVHQTGKHQQKSSGSKGTRGLWVANAECHYCHKIGHTKPDCPKLRQRRRPLTAHIASGETASDLVTISASEYAQLKHHSTQSSSVTAIAESESYDEADYW